MEKYAGAALGLGLVFLYTSIGIGFSQIDDFLALPAQARAAWVGALGSIVSIISAATVAICVSIYNNNKNAEKDVRTTRANRSAIFAAMHFTLWRHRYTAISLGRSGLQRNRARYLLDMLDRAIEALDKADPVIIADERGVTDYYRFRNTVGRFRRSLHRAIEKNATGPVIKFRIDALKVANIGLMEAKAERKRLARFRERYDLDAA